VDADEALVFGDVLQQRGDPRGELVAIQHQLELTDTAALRRRETELFAHHGDAFVGELGLHHANLRLRWARGFIVGARLTGTVAEMHLVLPILLEAPYVRETLADLRIGPSTDAAMCDPILRELDDHQPRWMRTFVLDAAATKLGWYGAPWQLRHLALRRPIYPEAIEKCTWSTLDTLELWHPQALRAVAYLDPARFPALRTLALVGTIEDLEITRFLEAPITAQLETLDLRGGLISLAGARRLAQLPATVRHLDVRGNVLSREAVAELVAARAAVGGTVAGEPQRRPIKNDPNRTPTTHSLLDRPAVSELIRRFDRALDESRGDLARTCVALLELVDAGDPQRERLAQAMRTDPGGLATALAIAERELRGGTARLACALAERHTGDDRERIAWQAVRHARWDRDAALEQRALALITDRS
jgi:hypothetical protein